MHEGTLLESKGNFTMAVCSARLMIQHLQKKQQSGLDFEEEAILADALMLYGKWMTKHKLEPANSILANYLEPAVDVSKSLHSS